MSTNLAAPVSQSERIVILDALRGIAILGILLMNIPGFALPDPTYGDPSIMNEWGTINFKVWYFIDWFMEGSQRALFSMLFGAGVVLFISGKEKKLEGLYPADYFYRRQIWLLVFGLINGYILLWFWDILFHYACIGMILFAFRRLSPRTLLIAAFVCLLFQTARENVDAYRDRKMISKGELVAKIDTTKFKLTELQKDDLGALTGFKEKTSVEGKKKKMEKSLKAVRGNYAELYEYQSNRTFYVEVFYLYYGIWDILIFMLIGMAFFKNGIMIGHASAKVYWALFIGGLGIGLTLSYFRLQPLIDYKFNMFEYTKNVQFEFYQISRTFRAIGIFGFIMVLYKSGLFKWLFNMFRPVGQMAFTNYMMQSMIGGIIFYGIGFGMFGKLQRYEIYYVVAAIYLFQIVFSHIWLRFFRFGPLEWLWRSLSYWNRQPFLRTTTTIDPPSMP
jgi:uncharacterized protein